MKWRHEWRFKLKSAEEEDAQRLHFDQLKAKDYSNGHFIIRETMVKDLHENVYNVLLIARRRLKQETKFNTVVQRYDSMEISQLLTPNLYAYLRTVLYAYEIPDA